MTLLKRLKRIIKLFVARIFRTDPNLAGIQYWQIRVEKYGKRSVLNIGHTEEEMEDVTQMQKDILFPILKKHLHGNEQIVVDFGCGVGRFTPSLAKLAKAKAIGVDPIKSLIDLAVPDPLVEYMYMQEGVIPLDTGQADIIWVCLVLGVIVDPLILKQTNDEICRTLKDGGLLFLVENTASKQSSDRFKFRSVEEYQAMFPTISLEKVSDYYDLGEQISIMVGRKA